MGRQSAGFVQYLDQAGLSKMLLEGTQIVTRGAVRAKIQRADLLGFDCRGEDLILTTDAGLLVASLGAAEAAAWVRALAKPVPNLREKLGLSAQRPAVVFGQIDDETLAQTLDGYISRDPGSAFVAIAQVNSADDLDTAVQGLGDLPLWCITVKGKGSPFSDDQARAVLRTKGYVDTKACAVSARLTATRWQRRAKTA